MTLDHFDPYISRIQNFKIQMVVGVLKLDKTISRKTPAEISFFFTLNCYKVLESFFNTRYRVKNILAEFAEKLSKICLKFN